MPTRHTLRLDGVEYETGDCVVTGREIRSLGRLAPASSYILIKIEDRSSRSIGLEEKVTLDREQVPELLSFAGNRVFSLIINERGFEWGAEEISAADIRLHAVIPDGDEIVFDSHGDRIIEDDETVRLTAKGVERIVSRPAEQVRIIVNTREKFVPPGHISFAQLVAIAFPNLPVGPTTAFTVSYRKGPGNKPEGTLIEGETVKLKKGMIFNVSATDKS